MRRREGHITGKLKVIEAPEVARVRTWVQLLKTSLVFQRRVVGIISDHGMTMPQFDVMATLKYGEGLTQQELAEQLLVTKGNICGLIDRLEDAGWVERRPDVSDARANRVYLTAAGRRKIESALPAHDAFVASLLQGISLEEANGLRDLLRRVEEGIRE